MDSSLSTNEKKRTKSEFVQSNDSLFVSKTAFESNPTVPLFLAERMSIESYRVQLIDVGMGHGDMSD